MKKIMGWLLVLSVGMFVMGCSEDTKKTTEKKTETKTTEKKEEKKD